MRDAHRHTQVQAAPGKGEESLCSSISVFGALLHIGAGDILQRRIDQAHASVDAERDQEQEQQGGTRVHQ